MNWQPIETAPKDGQYVFLWWPYWCDQYPAIAWWNHDEWRCPEALTRSGDGPTHWMPLPPPPTQEPAQ